MKFKVFLAALIFFVAAGTAGVLAQSSAENDELLKAVDSFSRLNDGEKQMIMSSMGVPKESGFTVAKIIAWFIFGSIGLVAFIYGKKEMSFKPLIIGVLLMMYPYFVTGTVWLYVVGIGLTLLLKFWRD